jgi:hypothetical protein
MLSMSLFVSCDRHSADSPTDVMQAWVGRTTTSTALGADKWGYCVTVFFTSYCSWRANIAFRYNFMLVVRDHAHAYNAARTLTLIYSHYASIMPSCYIHKALCRICVLSPTSIASQREQVHLGRLLQHASH